MKNSKMKNAVLSIAMLLGTVTCLSGCQNNNSTSTSKPSTSISTGTSTSKPSTSTPTSTKVDVASISAELANNELKVGEEKQLNVNVLPNNATNKKVKYSVNNDIVSVSDSGLVKALKEGKATVTVTSEDGNKSAQVNVFVSKYQNEYNLEAEDASLSACAASSSNQASNGQLVGQIGEGSESKFVLTSDDNQTVDLKVVAAVVGADRLNFAKYFSIDVNGVTLDNLKDDSIEASENYGYFNFGKVIFNGINLVKGKNTIIFKGAKDVQTNLDKIVIKADKLVKWYTLDIPDGTGKSYYFEHDDAVLGGGSSGYFNVSEASGARSGNALGNCFNNNGATISYKVTAEEAKEATLYVCMALGSANTENPFKVSLNGEELEIPTTYKDSGANWNHFVEFKVALLNLIQGENEIVITITGGCGNFDYIKIVSETKVEVKKEVPAVSGTEYRLEAEYAQLEKCSVGTDNNGASGNNHVGGINGSSKLTFNVTSDANQTVSLKLRMIIVGTDRLKLASNFTLEVNGNAVTSDDEFTTLGLFGTWNNWGELTIKDVALNEGTNVIKLVATSNAMTNVDYISIYADKDVYFTTASEKTDYRFEGTEATLTNCSIVSEADLNASGGSHVGQIGTGSEIKYQITSSQSQFVDLKIVSAIVGSDRLAMKVNYKEVTVNGNPLFYNGDAKFNVPPSYGYGAWTDFVIKGVYLKTGINEIVLKTADGAMTNFDYIEISAANAVELYCEITGDTYTFEAENATLTNGSSGAIAVNNEPTATNGKALGNVFNNYNATIAFTLNASEATKVKLSIVMALGSNTDNPFTITLNGKEVEVPTHYEDAEANWAHYKEFELATIDLSKGENTLVFTITGGCGNFDCIKVLSPKTIA